MRYINPARKVIADGKRAFAKIEITLKCPACSLRLTKELAGLKREDFNCPTCGANLEREQSPSQTGDSI